MFCQNLGALEDRKAMKYAKQVRGLIQELSTACKTSRIYSLDDVTTHVPKYVAAGQKCWTSKGCKNTQILSISIILSHKYSGQLGEYV